MNKSYYSIFIVIIFSLTTSTYAHPLEHIALHNIRQITFPSMGFEKAGESYFSPDGKTLIFQAVPTGKKEYQIYGIDIEKGKPYLISTGRGACTCAYFKPDGKKIIFASSHETPENFENDNQNVSGYQRDTSNYIWKFTPYMNIYEANPDGSDLVALTTGAAYKAECSYSSDGSHIVFASNATGTMQLYIMRADGTNTQQITHSENGYNGGPFFCPKNSKVVFRADYEKKDYLQIYCLDLKTKTSTQLTSNNAVNWAPFWHPNEEVIVFTTSIHGHSNYELYLLNINTKAIYRLTHNPGFDGLASFNKNGTQITWTSKRGSDGTCQIFIADFVMPELLLQET